MSLEKAESITRPEFQTYENGSMLNHISCGYFNLTKWEGEFARWTYATGMWELSDPQIPTLPSGNTVDRFLLLPG